ncbi:NUDIX hydrolase domain-like protein [Microdochium trichocladiopsis]|uniref:NUDIX hydrolase domain-like protein n=1 Tax=Microdochium trichocladiopsis TaxID=1682393 RepID=A0A9P8YET2_9PEZI|nr:NUDIX hydrolase domain-like protein [Microdochium trichocladiopsis]KAH7035667.1 NUDIX hydrolase domain-like protein [Microdochium trichocladiopsis]
MDRPLLLLLLPWLRVPLGRSSRVEETDTLARVCSFPYADKPAEAADHAALMSTLYTLVWKDNRTVLGYLRDHVVEALLAVPEPIRGPVTVDREARTIHAFESSAGEARRTETVGKVMAYWRDNDTFEVLRGWRDEPWPVYGSVDEVLYSVERSGAGLFGVLRHGVHMMAYVLDNDGEGHRMKIWISRRSPTKQTYPGMLDNTVAGGFMTGEIPFECMVREADEEASLPDALMRERCRHTGIVTYIHITDERAGGEAGQIYPEMQWIYDIELPPDVIPVPKDGEVAGFELMTVEQVQDELARGSFKPNCALVLLEFFVRHGILTRENEPGFDEIVARMHRALPLPGPHLAYRSPS